MGIVVRILMVAISGAIIALVWFDMPPPVRERLDERLGPGRRFVIALIISLIVITVVAEVVDALRAPLPDLASATTYPTTVTIAGVAWIASGGVILLYELGSLVFSLLLAETAGSAADSCCGSLFYVLPGAAFVRVGVKSTRGTARDTLGSGIGSILFGLLLLGGGLLIGSERLILAWIYCLVGAGLIAAGVVALVGRGEYSAWRQAQKGRVGAGPAC